MNFTQRFCLLLDERNITAYRVAKETGISERLVGFWKAGQMRPHIDNLIRLADYFQVSIDYLVGRSDDPAMR